MTASDLKTPWRTYGDCAGILSTGDGAIARVYWGADQPERYRATARLMAAAPELLRALQLMLDAHQEGRHITAETATIAWNAIADATDITTPDLED